MSEAQFAMVSGWMSNGNISEFVKANPGENRFNLVRISLKISLAPLRFIDDQMNSWKTSLGD